jgi:predicted Zn-dependent protease
MNLSNDTMLPKLKAALGNIKSEHSDFYAWKVTIQDYQSLQTLMIGRENKNFEKYQNREVIDHNYHIEVFTRHGDPLVMGNSSFAIDPLDDLEKQVLKTYNNSLLVRNKPWDLPQQLNEDLEKVLTTDPVINESLSAAHQKLDEEINQSICKLSKVKVNSGELFTNLKKSYFETSFGLNGQKESSDIYFEIALEKLPTPNTQEVLKYKKAISIEDANLRQFINDAVEETLSISSTEVPVTADNLNILVDGEFISDIMNDIVLNLSARREYEKTPFFSKGDQIFTGEKYNESDSINLHLDPTIPVMALTTPYTSEGMKPIKAQVIKNDIVLKQTIHNRIGQYLGKKPNYISGNMILEKGSSTKKELLKSVDECIEIIAFSSLLINSNTLTWSSEIKLGKLYRKGEFVSMIKGGVVSGDIKANLSNFCFSNDEIKINEMGGGVIPSKGYIGPKHMIIKSGVKVVGEYYEK